MIAGGLLVAVTPWKWFGSPVPAMPVADQQIGQKDKGVILVDWDEFGNATYTPHGRRELNSFLRLLDFRPIENTKRRSRRFADGWSLTIHDGYLEEK